MVAMTIRIIIRENRLKQQEFQCNEYGRLMAKIIILPTLHSKLMGAVSS